MSIGLWLNLNVCSPFEKILVLHVPFYVNKVFFGIIKVSNSAIATAVFVCECGGDIETRKRKPSQSREYWDRTSHQTIAQVSCYIWSTDKIYIYFFTALVVVVILLLLGLENKIFILFFSSLQLVVNGCLMHKYTSLLTKKCINFREIWGFIALTFQYLLSNSNPLTFLMLELISIPFNSTLLLLF